MDIEKRVARYKERALQARLEAERMTSVAAKTGLLKIAENWEQLAEDLLKEHASAKPR